LSATSVISPVHSGQEISSKGLTSDEARARLEKDGPNAMPDTSAHPLRSALAKFWAPVPWLLEASIVLELALHKYDEAAVIAALLVFNTALAYFQESRAQATLAALKSRLALNASVERDGAWKIVLTSELVRGDLVKLSLGAVVAADVHLTGRSVQLYQSMLTGESLPIEAGPRTDTYAGTLVRGGEATAAVTATGARTKFGRTARSTTIVQSQPLTHAAQP
jgi:H+-transporting ATPase